VGERVTLALWRRFVWNPISCDDVDFSRLMPLVSASTAHVTKDVVDELDEKLASATVVPPEAIAPDVVTMNSKVLLSFPAWEAPREYRLVYSPQRACDQGELSVLSVLGTKLLGERTGARLALGSGSSFRLVELAALTYQPEAAGDWDL
jgi:regulator of nucleoside diphosphate kinase